METRGKTISMERPGARLMISNQNLRVTWKPVNPQDCVWKNLYRILMRTILQERRTIRYNITIWWPGRWGPQGVPKTGGGGLAGVPNLRVCKHL